ncbi:hypothetical protein HID58_050167 [Brassica napus]|uniref:Uncharacterized protein n=1 Tax=Brassica napus TaxID=3708 RepID=A0ABQ8A680_BRANA|nr:hypothetical protein HID58_050167 [Brassica napus]
MSLPASQYSVLDAERIERVDDNTFTLLNSSTLKCVLFCSLGSKSKLMAAASSSCLARCIFVSSRRCTIKHGLRETLQVNLLGLARYDSESKWTLPGSEKSPIFFKCVLMSLFLCFGMSIGPSQSP